MKAVYKNNIFWFYSMGNNNTSNAGSKNATAKQGWGWFITLVPFVRHFSTPRQNIKEL